MANNEEEHTPSLVILKQNNEIIKAHTRAINRLFIAFIICIMLAILVWAYFDYHNILSNIVKMLSKCQ